MRLTILHTNDLHGRIEQLPRIATLIRRERDDAQRAGRHALVVDAGDSEEETLLESTATRGQALMAMLNAVGYDLAALGNAIVLRYGPQALAAEARVARFPIFAANFRWPDGRLVEGAADRLILDLGGFRLGLTGVTADYSASPWNDLYRGFGLGVTSPIDAVAEQATRLREEGAQAVGVISHIGFDEPRRWREDQTLAESVPGLAFIVGAHSHTVLPEPRLVNGTPIVQAGDYGRFVGRLDLTLDPATGQAIEVAGRLFPVTDDIAPAPDVEAAINEIRADVARVLDQPVGALAQPLDLADDRECGIGDWLADCLRAQMGAEVGLVQTGLLRAPLDAGPVTQRMLFQTCPTGANPGRAWLTGAQLQAILERALDPALYQEKSRPFRGRPRGVLQVSGLIVRYAPGAPSGQRLREVRVGDAPLDPDRRYLVAATDAELGGGSPFTDILQLSEDDITYAMPTVAGDLLDADLRQRSPVEVNVGGRLVVMCKP